MSCKVSGFGPCGDAGWGLGFRGLGFQSSVFRFVRPQVVCV